MHNKVEIIELVFECAFVAPHSLALFLRTFMSKCQNLYISEIVCLDWTTLKPRAFSLAFYLIRSQIVDVSDRVNCIIVQH